MIFRSILTMCSQTDRIAKAERETDDHRLYQRQKQIDYGKNTSGYLNYISEVSVYVQQVV